MKKIKGIYTAIVTPFDKNQCIDWKSFEVLVERQIKAGVDGIVFIGTTGESPTIVHEEMKEIFRWSVKQVNKRAIVVHNVGSYSTQKSLECAEMAAETGADLLMAVNPYYNKPNQEGLFQHFSAIANHVAVPLMLYNIQGRTSVNLETPTLLRLAQNPNIVAVKEASANLDQQLDVIHKMPPDFSVMSGDDGNILPFIASGGDGVVSVVANVIPKTFARLTHLLLDGKIEEARPLFYEVLNLIRLMFCDTSPIPVKEMMALLGYCEPTPRLPLVRLSSEKQALLKASIKLVNDLENE